MLTLLVDADVAGTPTWRLVLYGTVFVAMLVYIVVALVIAGRPSVGPMGPPEPLEDMELTVQVATAHVARHRRPWWKRARRPEVQELPPAGALPDDDARVLPLIREVSR